MDQTTGQLQSALASLAVAIACPVNHISKLMDAELMYHQLIAEQTDLME